MPSLNLDLDYFSNPKILRLVALLGDEGFVIPIRLWCYVAKHHAETGKLAGYSKPEIEQIVGWRGAAERCVAALLTVKLLEKTRAHRRNMTAPQNAPKQPQTYAVHDWGEHAGHVVCYKKRAKLAAKARWAKYENASSMAANTDASSNAPTSHLISSHSDPKQDNTEEEDEENARVNTLPPPTQVLSVEEIRTEWNKIAGPRQCKTIERALLDKLNKLRQTKSRAWWDVFFREVAGSPFMTGHAPPAKGRTGSFRADLDWATEPINLAKLMSGKYDDTTSPHECQCGSPVYLPSPEETHSPKPMCKAHYKAWREDEQRRAWEAQQRAQRLMQPHRTTRDLNPNMDPEANGDEEWQQ